MDVKALIPEQKPYPASLQLFDYNFCYSLK
jgi:hypothetical protein